MTGTVHYQVRDGIAVLRIDNPPLNAITAGVGHRVVERLKVAIEDERVSAVVVTGSRNVFSAGADLANDDDSRGGINALNDVIDAIEACGKPVIAALNGTILGGGVELALGCDYRIAAADVGIGMPEARFGLIPGGGGTQRLPRLIGAQPALDLLLSAKPLMADEALALGLIDRIAVGKLVSSAMDYGRELVSTNAGKRRVRDADVEAAPAVFERARDEVRRSRRDELAAMHVVSCVQAAVDDGDFVAGLAVERARYEECRADPQRAALVHCAVAERRAGNVPGLDDVEPMPVGSAAVVGAGTMGSGIAMALANAGIRVRLHDSDAANLRRGLDTIRKNYDRAATRGALSRDEVEMRLALIETVDDFDALADGDVAIEAVHERLDTKRAVFARLDNVMRPGAILATNTSSLDIDAIAVVTRRPESVCGLHFFSPAHVMPLVEVVRGASSSPVVLRTAMTLAERLGKVGVMAGNCPGFIGNRMMFAYLREAHALALAGMAPADVDRVLYDFGFAMGPFAMADLVGLDLGWHPGQQGAVANAFSSPLTDAFCEFDRFGQKNGLGFYRYDENRTRHVDPEGDTIIRMLAADLGIEPRTFTDDEVLVRCLYPLINVGAALVSEGHALRPGDIDVVYVNGYGFPCYRGGPMWYADALGLDRIVADLDRLYGETGEAS